MNLQHFFSTLMNLSTLVFVVTSMLAMGLSLRMAQIIAPLRNTRLVIAALAASLVLLIAVAQSLRALPAVQAFIVRHPGIAQAAPSVDSGFPWWLQLQHFLELLLGQDPEAHRDLAEEAVGALLGLFLLAIVGHDRSSTPRWTSRRGSSSCGRA